MNQQPLHTSGGDTKALQVIRQGMNIHVAQGDFWGAFVRVSNNTDGMAELLGIRPDQLSRLTSRIRDLVQEAKDNPGGATKKMILPTGGGGDPNQETQ